MVEKETTNKPFQQTATPASYRLSVLPFKHEENIYLDYERVVRAYFGMIDNAKCHLEINDNNPIFEQFVEPAIVRFKKSQDDMVGVLRGLVENSQQRY